MSILTKHEEIITYKEIVSEFEKVSFNQFKKDCIKTFGFIDDENNTDTLKDIYDNIILPRRSTSDSAGYDFYIPIGVELKPGETVTIPTGIRCKMKENWFLGILPRSGLGFKYRVAIVNTLPVIDSDYYNSDNEGHIMIKFSYDSFPENIENAVKYGLIHDDNDNHYIHVIEKETVKYPNLVLKQNDRFVQGIFFQYGITKNDDPINKKRSGGIGSTGL